MATPFGHAKVFAGAARAFFYKIACHAMAKIPFGFRACGAGTFPHPPKFLPSAKIWAVKYPKNHFW
jgi:hypothetical protein